jgi:plasmid stabilization system protein ParE
MSLRLRKTAEAKADILEIAEWISDRSGSMNVAVKWMKDLDVRFRSIADAPGTGTLRPELGAGIRSSPFGNYLIIFKASARALTVIRVRHGARDTTGQLAD